MLLCFLDQGGAEDAGVERTEEDYPGPLEATHTRAQKNEHPQSNRRRTTPTETVVH